MEAPAAGEARARWEEANGVRDERGGAGGGAATALPRAPPPGGAGRGSGGREGRC